MVYYFSNIHIREVVREHASEVKDRFQELCEQDVEFLNSFETSTKNIQPTNKRYTAWGEALNEITGLELEIPSLI